jgi:hypothetical protein
MFGLLFCPYTFAFPASRFFPLHGLQQNVQAVVTGFPEFSVGFGPARHPLESLRFQRAEMFAATPFFLNEPGAFQVGQMLGHRLLAHRKRFGKLIYRERSLHETPQELPAGGVGERCEGLAERIHNHMVVHYRGGVKSKMPPSSISAQGYRCAPTKSTPPAIR